MRKLAGYAPRVRENLRSLRSVLRSGLKPAPRTPPTEHRGLEPDPLPRLHVATALERESNQTGGADLIEDVADLQTKRLVSELFKTAENERNRCFFWHAACMAGGT
jgi:hypothetical protein